MTEETKETIIARLGEVLFKTWPYKTVEGFKNVFECQQCHCLVVNRIDHAKACFSSLSDEDIKTMAQEMGRLLRETHISG